VPKDPDLHLVLDNYATHKTPAIHQWLVRNPRFHLHFTPTSSSWLNLVERWFAELTNRKLRRSAHRSVTALETGIRKWINEWNKDPKPFVWTKTAAYCSRISESGHQLSVSTSASALAQVPKWPPAFHPNGRWRLWSATARSWMRSAPPEPMMSGTSSAAAASEFPVSPRIWRSLIPARKML
jgi:transposase